MHRSPTLALAALTALACSPTGAPAQDQPWRVTRVGTLDVTPQDDVFIDFADGRIAGRTGCNRFTGSITLSALTPSAGRVDLGPVAGTRMGCLGRGGVIESAFLAALNRVTDYRIDPDGTLVLEGGADGPIRAHRR